MSPKGDSWVRIPPLPPTPLAGRRQFQTRVLRINVYTHSCCMKKISYVVLFLIFASLRLIYSSNHVVFSQDQARDALYMKQFAAQNQIIIGYGPKASVGNFYLPPFYYQLHYFFSLISGNQPLIMQWVITLVEAATPLVLFAWLRLLVSRKAALIGAVGYFFFLLPTVFGTTAWNPNMIPFFSTLAAYCWFRVILKNERWSVVAGLFALTIAIHLHYQSVVLLPFAALVFIYDLKRDPKNIKWWLLGGLLGGLTFVPYLLAEIQSGWHNTLAIKDYFTQEHSQYFDRVSKLGFVVTFLPDFTEKVIAAQYIPYVPFLLVGRLVFWTGFASLLLVSWRIPKWRWVALYFLSILVMLRIYKGDKLEYYLSTLYILPAFFLVLWWQKLKFVALGSVLILALMAGRFYTQHVSTNDVTALTQSMEFLDQTLPEDQSFGLLFHNDDHINIFAYALADNPRFNVRPGSRYLVDICQIGTRCRWDGREICQENRSYTYAALLKASGGYQPVVRNTSSGKYEILVGTLDNPVERVGYPLYEQNNDYGSDFILNTLYRD